MYWTEYTATVTVRDCDGMLIDKYRATRRVSDAKVARAAMRASAKTMHGEDVKVSITGLKELIWDASH